MSTVDTPENGPAVVIPLRPRDQVTPRIGSFRSIPPEHPWCASAPMRIEGTVTLLQLIRGLRSAGLDFVHDKRTGEFVGRPVEEAKS